MSIIISPEAAAALERLPPPDPRITPYSPAPASVGGAPPTPAAIISVPGLPIEAGTYLNLRVVSSVAPVTIALSVLIQVGSGPPMKLSQSFTIANANTVTDGTLALVGGHLLSVTLLSATANLTGSACSVQVWLQRPSTGGAAPSALLVSDYLLTSFALGWP